MRPGDLQHFIRHIDADDFALRPDNLRGDETNFSRAAAEIEDGLAFAQILARIAATVIALDYFLRNGLEIFRFVIDGTTKFVGGAFAPAA